MSGTDRPGPPESTRGEEYDQALTGLREVLEQPTAGHLRRGAELAELDRLISRYLDETKQILNEMDGNDK
ncbi:hypothetical protein [Actinoallomurus sp. NPDC052274]|uniref:hypothetical protein n=1 Tax=Actinoallomurus sp. NPDC052274 TaxID=3155420 RepID=UPI003418C82B